jgi:microcystin-dependent protein
MKKPLLPLFTAALLALAPALCSAQSNGVPNFIDYQGKVLDSSGNLLAPDAPTNYEVQFRIYDAATGGTVIWAEKQLVTVLKGEFSVRLGEGQPILTSGGGAEGSVGQASPGLQGAFATGDRHLGLTVVIPGQTVAEIQPRLAFLAAPFALKAAAASTLTQAPGTQSNLMVGSVAYSNQVVTSTQALDGASRTVLVNSTTAAVTATLPQSAAQKELLVYKSDSSLNYVTVKAPSGGSLNGVANGQVYLKVRGEAVTVVNVGANDWLILTDSRDKTPVGTIIAYGSNSVPAGYLPCNGAVYNIATHPELAAAIGMSWGSDSVSLNFRAPDLRGQFLRGRDGGRGLDPDRNGRLAPYANAATGDNVGSSQGHIFASHSHSGSTNTAGEHSHSTSVGARFHSATGDGYNGGAIQLSDRSNWWQSSPSEIGVSVNSAGAHSHSLSIDANGGNETRPVNSNVNYVIKY